MTLQSPSEPSLGWVARQASLSCTPTALLDVVIQGMPVAGLVLVDVSDPGVPRTVASVGDTDGPLEPFPLPAFTETLQVAWTTRMDDPDLIQALVGIVAVNRDRQRLAARLEEVKERSDTAQSLAHMGDYEWDIVNGAVTWSDELYRIYGLHPQSETITYDRFIGMIHPEDQERIRAIHAEAYRTTEPYAMTERIVRPDGDVRVLESQGTVDTDEHGNPTRMRGSCLDVTVRVRAEEALRQSIEDVVQLDARLHDARRRRRQAVEINDNVIQRLTTALLALEDGRGDMAANHMARVLEDARKMMRDLLEDDQEPLRPGELVRDSAAMLDTMFDESPPTADPPAADRVDTIRVLLVDDALDLRYLLRLNLERDRRFVVVGEAGNGSEAVEQAAALQPDVVLLDVAMPVMDGLTALPLVREVAPDTTVIMLSGFARDQLAERSLRAGAAAYVEKGEAVADVVGTILAHESTTAPMSGA
ncbi:MAG: response regulator [Actinomycetota bacterium]